MQICLVYVTLPYSDLKMLISIMLIEKDNLKLNAETKILKARIYKITFSRDKSRVK